MKHGIVSRLSSFITIFSILLAALSVLVSGTLWMVSERRNLNQRLEEQRQAHIRSTQELVESRVEDTVDLVEAEIGQYRMLLQERLKDRVANALKVAENLNSRYRSQLGRAATRRLVIEALRPVRYDDGRGYIFSVGFDGTELLYPLKPELEGTNVLDLTDVRGNPVIRMELEAGRRSGGGFAEGWWINPESGEPEAKISFVAALPELEMIIGTGDYFSAFQRDMLEELQNSLERLPMENDEYFFGGTYSGVSIIGPSQGINMWDVRDSNGLFVVRELSRLAQYGGGFLQYRIPEETGLEPITKLSYVQGIDELEWYIGVGFNLQSTDQIQSALQLETGRLLKERLIIISATLLILLMAGLAVSMLFSRSLNRRIRTFVADSELAAGNRSPMPTETLPFDEFRELAGAMNRTIEQIWDSLREKEVLLKEIHHRVKNNLQIISSILNLQQSKIVEDPKVRETFQQCQFRIASMALIHEQLYVSDNLARIEMDAYLETLSSLILSGYSGEGNPVELEIDCPPFSLDLDRAIPMGLIITELVSNSIRHAEPPGNEAIRVTIGLKLNSGTVELTVEDNGISAAELNTGTGLGVLLVDSLVNQLGATAESESRSGCRWQIAFTLGREAAKAED